MLDYIKEYDVDVRPERVFTLDQIPEAHAYLDSSRQPTEEFFELLESYKQRLKYAERNTSLPEAPDFKAIREFTIYVNERAVKGDI